MSEKMIVACPECETRFVAPLEKFLPNGRKVRCAKCGHSWFQGVDGSDAQSDEAATQPEVAATDVPKPPPVAAPTESIMDRAAQATAVQPMSRAAQASEESATPSEGSSSAATGLAAGVTAATAASTAKAATSNFGEDEASDYTEEPLPISMNEPRRKRRFWPRALLYSLAAVIVAGALGYFFKDQIASQVPTLDPPLTTWQKTVDGVVSTVVPSNRALRIENVKYDLDGTGDKLAMLLTADVANESGSVQEAPTLSATIYAADDAVLKTVSVTPEEAVTEIEAQTSLTYFLRLPDPPENLERVEVDFSE